MSDDWRLRIDLRDAAAAEDLTDRLQKSEHELEGAFHDQVALSRDGAEVFAYTGTRELADRIAELTRSLADEHGWQVETALHHWHPTAEEWEDPDKPLPADDAAKAAEHAELIERERAEVEQRGYPEFEVRLEFHSHRDAKRFAEQLRQEGLPNVHRWKYVVVGATDEDAAQVLAERLRGEVPPGTIVKVEGTWQAMRAETPTSLRSTIFGGMSG